MSDLSYVPLFVFALSPILVIGGLAVFTTLSNRNARLMREHLEERRKENFTLNRRGRSGL